MKENSKITEIELLAEKKITLKKHFKKRGKKIRKKAKENLCFFLKSLFMFQAN
jgi:hypothetical protein